MNTTKTSRAPVGERHRRIVNAVLEVGEVDVTALADTLGVSQMTVRRDLRHLDEAGLIRRVHGGATFGRVSPALRSATMQKEKAAIASGVASLIDPDAVIGLDVGSTCTAVAQQLGGREGLTVVTGSLHAALQFDASSSEVFLLGGRLTSEGAIIGSSGADDLPVALDTLVLGCGGLSAEDGVTYHDWDETIVRRSLAKHARKIILAADHTKFEAVRPFRFGALGLIDVLVTDAVPAGSLAEALQAANVSVVVV